MSEKLFDNKQVMHVVSEVIVLCGISFYFTSKIKGLQGIIEELSQRLEDQEDKLQKLDQYTTKMNNGISGYIKEKEIGYNAMNEKLQELERSLSLLKQERSVKQEKLARQENLSQQEKTVDLKQPVLEPKTKKSSLKANTPSVSNPIEKMLSDTMKMMQVPIIFENPITTKIKFVENQVPIELEEEEENDDLSDSELDNEIQDELNDLKQSSVKSV